MDISEFNYLDKNLSDNDWIGVIVNNQDPLSSGRAQIRVFRLFDDIPAEDLPWAVPINSTRMGSNGAASLSVPKVGIIVRVQFNNADIYAPEYTTIQNIDSELIEEIREDYDGTHVLLYDSDQELNLIFQPNRGLQMYYRESFIQISPDQMITIQHANQDSLIQLEGETCNIVTKNEVNVSAGSKVNLNADEVVAEGNQTTKTGAAPYSHAVLGEPLIALLSTLATAIDAKLPASPGVNVGLVEQTKQSVLSRNVLVGR